MKRAVRLWYAAAVKRALAILGSVLLAACGDENFTDEDQRPVEAADLGVPADAAPANDLGTGLAGGTYLLRLDAGAFPPTPAHPSALVHVPPGFDPTPPIALVVYIHGFNNCVENIVREKGESCDPQKGTPARTAFSLLSQLHSSQRNAVFLAPEVAFDQSSADPGNLGKTDGFKALLAEALKALPEPFAHMTPRDVGDVVVASHSGGYQVAGAIAARGGVPVREIYLLDSLYGSTTEFDAWVTSDLGSFAGSAPRRRFASCYTMTGGTLARSQAMADRARGWVMTDPSVLVDDRTTSTWPDATYRHGLLFKLSELSHDGVPRYYFSRLLSSSGLPRLGP